MDHFSVYMQVEKSHLKTYITFLHLKLKIHKSNFMCDTSYVLF